jgi:diguanylate cyclase (GGDEF)-like protein
MRVSGTNQPGAMFGSVSARPSVGAGVTQAAPTVRPAPDMASVLGIPASEFTPRVRAAILRLMGEVDAMRQELADQRRRMAAVETDADQDILLPCLNRRAFVRELSRILSFVERYGLPASLVYIDLDNFKDINDRFGQAAGDAALSHVCEVIKGHIRESDLLGRLGGDEFGLLLAKANQREADMKADLISQIIKASPFIWAGKAIQMSFTTGAYEFRPGENPAEAMSRADKAMNERKSRPRP